MKLVKHNLKEVEIEILVVDLADKDLDAKVKAFEPDVIIAEDAIENIVVIDKALSSLCAIGLYKPSLDDINAFDLKDKVIPKIIYLDDDYYKYVFDGYGKVVDQEVDYFEQAIDLVYNVVG